MGIFKIIQMGIVLSCLPTVGFSMDDEQPSQKRNYLPSICHGEYLTGEEPLSEGIIPRKKIQQSLMNFFDDRRKVAYRQKQEFYQQEYKKQRNKNISAGEDWATTFLFLSPVAFMTIGNMNGFRSPEINRQLMFVGTAAGVIAGGIAYICSHFYESEKDFIRTSMYRDLYGELHGEGFLPIYYIMGGDGGKSEKDIERRVQDFIAEVMVAEKKIVSVKMVGNKEIVD